MAELMDRSTWAVAKQEFNDTTSRPGYVSCIEGDLIQLKNAAKDEALTSEGCDCINMATDEEGRIQTTQLHILPCVDQPKDDILRLFRSPKYYARRATELLRQQNLEASVQVHGQEEGGQQEEEEEEEEELHELIFVTKKDGEKQETAGNYVVGGDSSREEDFENEEPKDDPLLATIGFDSDFFNALSMFGREDLQKNDAEENISSGKKQSSYV